MTHHMTPDDIKKLAHLSRLATTEEERAKFASEIDSILGYVNQINTVAQGAEHIQSKDTFPHRNIMRDDIVKREVVEDGTIMPTLAPNHQDGYVKVKKILNQD